MRRLAAALLAILVLAVPACAGPDPVEEYWVERFEYYRSLATTDFERDALADNEISRAEYEEATQRYVDCMIDRGLPGAARYEIAGSGVYGYTPGAGGDETIMDSCEAGTVAVVERLYLEVLEDPERRGHKVMIVECLQRNGLLPADYDVADFDDDLKEFFVKYFDVTEDNDAFEALGVCAMNPTM